MENEKPTPTIEELMAQIEGLSKQVDVLATDNESLAEENRQLASVLTDAKAAQDGLSKRVRHRGDFKILVK